MGLLTSLAVTVTLPLFPPELGRDPAATPCWRMSCRVGRARLIISQEVAGGDDVDMVVVHSAGQRRHDRRQLRRVHVRHAGKISAS